MKKLNKRIKKRIWVATGVLLAAATVLIIVFLNASEPPLAAVDRCRVAIRQANDLQAGRYAPEELARAEIAWQTAMQMWQAENSKWFWQRDFSVVEQHISNALNMAEAAIERSSHRKTSLANASEERQSRTVRKKEHFNALYRQLPAEKQILKTFARGEMLLQEGLLAFERREYDVAEAKFAESENCIDQSLGAMEKQLRNYLTSVPVWQRWVSEAVSQSRKTGGSLVVVDKLAYLCRIYRAGKVVKEYSIEMGPNWIGDKNQRGDRMTPEGRYHVVKKKSGDQTKYYKALLINYPNDDDRQRFAEAKKRGQIAKNADIGGLIEIHGGGGRGIHWTDGCVALTNAEMDSIFPMIAEGTPVVIVGSLESHEAFVKKNGK